MKSMADRGGIRNVEAYARGKMLDHSSWQKGIKLPRSVTPSDIDIVFDNAGWLLHCEVSSKHTRWEELAKEAKGQALLYENLIFQTSNCAALCRHSVPLSERRAINSREDINAFQLMLYAPRSGVVYSPVYKGGARWNDFVHSWFGQPKDLHAALIRQASAEAA